MRGLRGIRTIRDFNLKDKRVFLRLDLNVPMENGKITDETRITAAIPTIKYAMEQGAKLVLASHFGRPKSAADKEYSLEPVAARLSDILKKEVLLVEEPMAEAIRGLCNTLKSNQLLMLENLRFEEGETTNSVEFAQTLASFTEIYINDAFGASHRAHASIEALPALLQPNQRGIGLLIEKEVTVLDQLLDNPKRPYIAILGGSKVSDKIPVIEKLIDVVDGFIIGGAMAYTFLKAQGVAVGKSRVEADKVNYAREMIGRMEARRKSLLLPVDHIVASSITDKEGTKTPGVAIPEDKMALDIGPQTIKNFAAAIGEAQTIFWNGPMGVFETEAFSKGSFEIARLVGESKGMTVVGGGDSAAAAEQSGFAGKMTHISTGGGASLEYLQGDRLPGLEILRSKNTNATPTL